MNNILNGIIFCVNHIYANRSYIYRGGQNKHGQTTLFIFNYVLKFNIFHEYMFVFVSTIIHFLLVVDPVQQNVFFNKLINKYLVLKYIRCPRKNVFVQIQICRNIL